MQSNCASGCEIPVTGTCDKEKQEAANGVWLLCHCLTCPSSRGSCAQGCLQSRREDNKQYVNIHLGLRTKGSFPPSLLHMRWKTVTYLTISRLQSIKRGWQREGLIQIDVYLQSTHLLWISSPWLLSPEYVEESVGLARCLAIPDMHTHHI